MYVDQLIFFVLFSHEIALDTRLMLLSFFPYYPVILYTCITLLVENAKKYVQYISSYFCYYFIFSLSRERISLFRNESMYQGRVFI